VHKSLLTFTAAAMVLAACSSGSNDVKTDAPDIIKEVVKETVKTSGVDLCTDMGPQTPRDIASLSGKNLMEFAMAPASSEMNLCNIHTHTNAEHKGPGFSVFVNNTDNGGYACNDSKDLTAAELTDPANGKGAFKGVKPGDTIEVHWVHTSCDITPGDLACPTHAPTLFYA